MFRLLKFPCKKCKMAASITEMNIEIPHKYHCYFCGQTKLNLNTLKMQNHFLRSSSSLHTYKAIRNTSAF